MLIYEGNLHKKIGAISQLGAEKITFPPKSDGLFERRLLHFCLLWPNRKTEGQNIYRIDAHMQDESTQKNGPLSKLATEKIALPPKPDGQTYIQTDISLATIQITYQQNTVSLCHSNRYNMRQTDVVIHDYRAALLRLKNNILNT